MNALTMIYACAQRQNVEAVDLYEATRTSLPDAGPGLPVADGGLEGHADQAHATNDRRDDGRPLHEEAPCEC